MSKRTYGNQDNKLKLTSESIGKKQRDLEPKKQD